MTGIFERLFGEKSALSRHSIVAGGLLLLISLSVASFDYGIIFGAAPVAFLELIIAYITIIPAIAFAFIGAGVMIFLSKGDSFDRDKTFNLICERLAKRAENKFRYECR